MLKQNVTTVKPSVETNEKRQDRPRNAGRTAMEQDFANCCNCGQTLGTYAPGSDHTGICPRCKVKYRIQAMERSLNVTILSFKGEPAPA